jgi:hypothetical protein
MLVIGPREMQTGNVSVRVHGTGNLGAKAKGEVVKLIRGTGYSIPQFRGFNPPVNKN